MPLPANANTGTVTGTFTNDDGSAASGRVVFSPNVTRLLDASANVIVVLRTHVAVLGSSGSFSQVLVATDDADLNPLNWTWTVREEIFDKPKRHYAIDVPLGTTRDLADISPVPQNDGVPTVVGPPVADGDKGDITVSAAGTVWKVDAVPQVAIPATRFDSPALGGGTLATWGVVQDTPCWIMPDPLNSWIVALFDFDELGIGNWLTAGITIRYVNASAATGVVRFQTALDPFTAGDTLPIIGVTTPVTGTAPAQNVIADLVLRSGATSKTVTTGKIHRLIIQRTPQNASDTLAGSIGILEVILTRTT